MADQYQITVPNVMMRLEADESAEASNEILYGERVVALGGNEGDWINVRADHDGYEGFIPFTTMGSAHETQHKVSAPITHIYSKPEFKSSVLSPLYMESRIATTDEIQNDFRKLQHGGWIFDGHLCPAKDIQSDHVATALQFENAPYLWGGRTAYGIDCSGLLQISLLAAGIECPRDTKDQSQTVGEPVAFGNTIGEVEPQRGDVVFFERHVGIFLDKARVLNATSRHMRVTIESLDDLIKAYGGAVSVRRL